MELILTFGSISADDTSIAGGKGASLGEMTAAGFPIPPGFVILADAYRQFIKQYDLREDIDAQLAAVNLEDTNSVDKASSVIQDMIHDVQMPDDLAEVLLSQFDSLDAPFVAVRSSATAEDSAVASWAGELDTFLNTTRETYIGNIKRCWASLFSPRAIFYRLENKLEDADVLVAVVVQKMVESDVAGVMFTVHPVIKDPNQMIIEAGLGLGEMLVSGQITPDSYIVAKDSVALMDMNIGDQRKRMDRDAKGSNQVTDCGDKGSAQKLTADQITEIAKLGKSIEEHYGFPCDIEWAIENGSVYITQSRPITTL